MLTNAKRRDYLLSLLSSHCLFCSQLCNRSHGELIQATNLAGKNPLLFCHGDFLPFQWWALVRGEWLIHLKLHCETTPCVSARIHMHCVPAKALLWFFHSSSLGYCPLGKSRNIHVANWTRKVICPKIINPLWHFMALKFSSSSNYVI